MWLEEHWMQQFNLHLPQDYRYENRQQRIIANHTTHREAAVFIGFDKGRNNSLILTQRAKHLKHHPGQVSFPGGKYEEQDTNLEQTALRELNEEIGISREFVKILGKLPPLLTMSGFKVTPIVGQVAPGYQLLIDHNEVDKVFTVPIEYIFNPNNLVTLCLHHQGRPHNIHAIAFNENLIWGATAQIIEALQRQFSQR